MEETKIYLHLSLIPILSYQPSSNEIEKLEWLGNFENILAGLYLKWKNVCIVTDNFNTDFLGEPMEPTHRYKNPDTPFLYTNTSQKLQEKKTLIDHISSNVNNKFLHTRFKDR